MLLKPIFPNFKKTTWLPNGCPGIFPQPSFFLNVSYISFKKENRIEEPTPFGRKEHLGHQLHVLLGLGGCACGYSGWMRQKPGLTIPRDVWYGGHERCRCRRAGYTRRRRSQ
ncbi:hypothetical protein M408DRAFT_197088 [Serendipita vermifera MAFF 305830]|uniref:Uncharacterized protein n=1 Tax=Serendipita vermifera MAFF 305830 TaxID=933852 RepID=A0A0C3B1V8_SERVB|nr:hypothetical protein M408DRAFT_197088 [Serendipita vermifera MAFF 305830]